jgi:hypothetical protein
MSTLAPLTEPEVRQLVTHWFHLLDIHAPVEAFLAIVADEGIEFRFPEVTVTDKAGLRQWYQQVIQTYFDEVHEPKEVTITTQGDRATIKSLTQWQESTWNPPAPKSERLTFLARHTWGVKRSDTTGQPVLVTYVVDSLEPVGRSGTSHV